MMFAFMPARLSALNDSVKLMEGTFKPSCIRLAYMSACVMCAFCAGIETTLISRERVSFRS